VKLERVQAVSEQDLKSTDRENYCDTPPPHPPYLQPQPLASNML
jgi:hypothetical protein